MWLIRDHARSAATVAPQEPGQVAPAAAIGLHAPRPVGQEGPNPTSLLPGATRIAELNQLKGNSSFSFIVERDSFVQSQQMIGP